MKFLKEVEPKELKYKHLRAVLSLRQSSSFPYEISIQKFNPRNDDWRDTGYSEIFSWRWTALLAARRMIRIEDKRQRTLGTTGQIVRR